MKISSLSVEYLHVDIECSVNPTSDTVSFAFMNTTGAPTVSDWVSGSWDNTITSSPYRAKCLIGTGGKVLATGSYIIWVKVTDSPEIPVRKLSDTLVVF